MKSTLEGFIQNSKKIPISFPKKTLFVAKKITGDQLTTSKLNKEGTDYTRSLDPTTRHFKECFDNGIPVHTGV